MQRTWLPWNFAEAPYRCVGPIDWANSARDIARELREASRQGKIISRSTLRAAILVLAKVQDESYVFDLPFSMWCASALDVFQKAAAGEFLNIPQEEAADWFELLSLFLEA